MEPVEIQPAVAGPEPESLQDASTSTAVAIATAGLVIALLIAWFVRRSRGGSGVQQQLRRAAGLSNAQWKQLRQFAARQGIPEPLALLISRGYFDAVVAEAPVSEARALARLRSQIYR